MPKPNEDAGVCSRGPRRRAMGSGTWFDLSKEFRIQYSICEKASTKSECEDGWEHFEDSCYQKLCALHNFQEATEACAEVGALLVSIKSEEENEFVRMICGAN